MGDAYDDLKRKQDALSDWSVEGAISSLKDKLFPASPDDQRMAASQAALTPAAPAPKPFTPAQSFLMGAVAPMKLGEDSAPAPAPAPEQPKESPSYKRALRVVAGMPVSASERTPAAFTSLQKPPQEAGTGGSGDAGMGVAENAPKQPPQEEKDADELRREQMLADVSRAASHTGRIMADGAWRAIGQTSNDAAFADGEKSAGQGVEDLMQRRMEADKARMKQEAKDAADPNSAKSIAASRALSKVMPEVFGNLQPGTLSAADIEKGDYAKLLTSSKDKARELASQEQKDIRDRASAEKIAAGNNATQRYVANLASDTKLAGKGTASGEVSPGYVQGSIPLKDEEKSKFRTAAASQGDLEKAASQLKALYAKKGTELTGDDAARMRSLVAKMKVAVKNIDALGALSGSDYKLMDDQVPDPTSVGANIKGLFGADNTLARLDQLVQNGRDTLSSGAKAMGLQRTQAAPAAPQGTVHMVNAKTGEQLFVQAGDVAHAKADGFQEG